MEKFNTLKQIVEYLDSCSYVKVTPIYNGQLLSTLDDNPAFIKLKEMAERKDQQPLCTLIKLKYDVILELYKDMEKYRCVFRAGSIGRYHRLEDNYSFADGNQHYLSYTKDFVFEHKELFEVV